MENPFHKYLRLVWYLPRYLAWGVVWLYQKVFSPDHSFWAKTVYPHGYCKFQPSCSQYMKGALLKYGFFKGGLKGAWRILRCNPWGKGGNDYL